MNGVILVNWAWSRGLVKWGVGNTVKVGVVMLVKWAGHTGKVGSGICHTYQVQ